MQTEVVTDDTLARESCHDTSRVIMCSASEESKDLSQPAPLYSQVKRQETRESHVLINPDEAITDAGDPLNASSPQESVTSATLSSFPITTESHLPEAFNSSQEHIGSEIFDSDTCVSSSKDNSIDIASISTTAILHTDYDNQAMLVSNNDLSADENKVLLGDTRSRQKASNSAVKPRSNKRAPAPPDYRIVMKHSGQFHVHESSR